MTNGQQRHSEYTEDFIAALQWMWGDGFLSPGGTEEVAELLKDIRVSQKEVLDIGCGLGVIDVLLVQEYDAAHVIGIDVEASLIDHANNRARLAGVTDRVKFELVDPGPLTFADESFDIVFSKDAIVHIPDKRALFEDVLRILRPGGVFVGSDWLRGDGEEFSPAAREWLNIVGLAFQMNSQSQMREAMVHTGFENIRLRDRNEWYRQEIKSELATLTGEKYDELVRRIGDEKAQHRVKSSTLKQVVVENGELRPTHLVGYKSFL